MPTMQFRPFSGNDLASLKDYILKLQRDLNYLLQNLDELNVSRLDAKVIVAETITGEKIAAETITANKMDVDELSAITANLGHITAGLIEAVEIYGSYIATANGTYPRIEFSSDDNLLNAMRSATNYISILPDVAGNPQLYFDNGSVSGSLGIIVSTLILQAITGNLQLSASLGDVIITAGPGDYVRFDSWSDIYSDAQTETLQQALDDLQDQIDDLDARVSALESP